MERGEDADEVKGWETMAPRFLLRLRAGVDTLHRSWELWRWGREDESP